MTSKNYLHEEMSSKTVTHSVSSSRFSQVRQTQEIFFWISWRKQLSEMSRVLQCQILHNVVQRGHLQHSSRKQSYLGVA